MDKKYGDKTVDISNEMKEKINLYILSNLSSGSIYNQGLISKIRDILPCHKKRRDIDKFVFLYSINKKNG